MAGREYHCVESEYFSMGDGEQKVKLSDEEMRMKEQKDAELDKKIKALRKKNEAILQRYQEIEEDRRNAEKEIIAATSQRPKQDGLTITITKSPNEKRIVSESQRISDNDDKPKLTMLMGKEMPKAVLKNIKIEDEKMVCKTEQENFSLRSKVSNMSMENFDNLFTFGRGQRRQVDMEKEKRIVTESLSKQSVQVGKVMQKAITMDSKVEGKRLVSQKIDPECLSLINKVSSMSMEDIDDLYTFGRGRRRQMLIEMEKEASMRKAGRKQVKVELEESCVREQNKQLSEKCQVSCSEQPVTMPTSEQTEYLKWKKEREQIDLERLVRHKNSRGEWRRPWDFGKTEDMFEDSDVCADTVPSRFCGRRGDGGRKMETLENVPSHKGSGKQISNYNTQKAMQTMSSRARGKDRLTGRAQRWNSVEGDYFPLSEDFLMLKGLDYRKTTRHSEGSSKHTYLNTENPKISVPMKSLENEDEIGLFANERVLLKNKQDIPFYKEEMEETCSVLPSEDTEIVEYLSVLHCDREPGDNTC